MIIAQQIDPEPTLIISTWDRIQGLENEMTQLEGHRQADGRHGDSDRPC